MQDYSQNLEALDNIEALSLIIIILFIFLILVIIRNWYNLYKKRSFRKKNRKLKEQLYDNQFALENYNEKLNTIKNLEKNLVKKKAEAFQLEAVLEDYKQKFYNTLSEKDKKIAEQKEAINYQKKAYDRYVDFKNVETNNTRLGAHFIKNVISQIYEDLEQVEDNNKSFLGIFYKYKKTNNKLPSLKALKSIFKLLDYNVSALNIEKTSIDDELTHIKMFLDLIKYLKPNANINFDNKLTNDQQATIKIKPTLFFPFVENALKHGSLNEEESFISIVLKENTNRQLSYCLINSAEQRLEEEHKIAQNSNFGLNALQQLLNAYYQNSRLEHKMLPNNQYLSELTLNLH